MNCAICGIQIDSVDDAIEEGWTPYFYDGAQLQDAACPSCTESLLQEGEERDLENQEEHWRDRTGTFL
jgi:hypothetical protein